MDIAELRDIAELKAQLETHPLYARVRTLDDLRGFMQHHAYAVWDFMSLLKFLQREIAPAHTPWLPAKNPDSMAMQRFINEIVLAEESDEGLPDADGKPTYISHFELYLGAMEEVGANTRPVRAFVRAVKKHGIETALLRKDIPEPARRFMHTTFDLLASGKPHVVAAAFALGREQIIPSMFRALLADMQISKEQAPLFHYYLERHVHLDDEFHGPLSLKLLEQVCCSTRKKRCGTEKAARRAIRARIALWDGVLSALPASPKKRSQ